MRIENVKNGWIPFLCAISRVMVLIMIDMVSEKLDKAQPPVVSYTCSISIMVPPNAWCEKGLV